MAWGDSIISDCYPGTGAGVASRLASSLGVSVTGVLRTGYRLSDLEERLHSISGKSVRAGLLSIGGNDLLVCDEPPDERWYHDFGERYRTLLGQLKQRFPGPWLVCNVYDPSDGTGQFPGRAERGFPPRPQLVEALSKINRVIAQVAGSDLFDLHTACMGYGWSRSKPELWYQLDIEPSRLGAQRIAELLRNRLPG